MLGNSSFFEVPKRIFIIDPSLASDYKYIAALVFMLNTSNIVIASRKIFDSLQEPEGAGYQLSFSDSQVLLPPPETIYYLSDNALSVGAVSAIINLYKRYEAVYAIYQQLIAQTYPISVVYVWVNGVHDIDQLGRLRARMPRAKFIISDENHGVWARFSFALNVQTE